MHRGKGANGEKDKSQERRKRLNKMEEMNDRVNFQKKVRVSGIKSTNQCISPKKKAYIFLDMTESSQQRKI